jgi:hypothetical protein
MVTAAAKQCQSRPNHRTRKCVLMKYFTERNQCWLFPSCCNTHVRFRSLYKFMTNVLSMKKIHSHLWTRCVTPSDIQIRSVCLLLSHDTWFFRASRRSGVGAARQDNCNVTSFEKKYLYSFFTSCKSTEKLNVLICQFHSMAAQFSFYSYNAYTSRQMKLWAGGSVWNRLPIPRSIRDKEILGHVRSYDTRSLTKVFSVRCNNELCEDNMWQGEFQ